MNVRGLNGCAVPETTRYLDLPRSQDSGPGKATLDVGELLELRRLRDTLPPIRAHAGRQERVQRLARRYGVSTRTILRAMKAEPVLVELGGHVAWFSVEEGRPPRQLTAWGPRR